MKILVINCGSSSIKYQLYDADQEKVLSRGTVARIGEAGSYFTYATGALETQQEMPVASHKDGFKIIMRALLDEENGVIQDLSEIAAVGHRTVHGGDTFVGSTIIDEGVIAKMEACIPLAPLHNPANLTGIKEARKVLSDVPHVAVFDTAFHQTMPPKAYLYAIPYEYYETHKIRKYGFHGTSCRYVARRTSEVLQRSPDELKMVICHLGNGVTIAAVHGGRSIDTSLGFTPVPGVMMGTRSGDIDPGLILYLKL
jgi:acetate kinase